jgi:PKHD-type hydroxylase
MQLSYSYYYFKSAIPKDTCQRIIDLGRAKLESEIEKGHRVDAVTFGDVEKSAMGPDAAPQGELTKQALKERGDSPASAYVRDSKVTWLNEQWIYDLVVPFIHTANVQAGWDWQWDYHEPFQFTVYDPSGFYSWHKDGPSDTIGAYRRYIHGVTPEPTRPDGRLPSKYVTDNGMVGKVRKISMTIQLNDPSEYDGGNLKFDFGHHTEGEQFHECDEIKEQGSIIIFPGFIDHCVTPLTRGTRYSLVLWTLGDPWK